PKSKGLVTCPAHGSSAFVRAGWPDEQRTTASLALPPRRGIWAYAGRGTWLWEMISSTCPPDRLLLLRAFGVHTSTRISPAAVWRGTPHRGQNCHRQGPGNRL